MQPTHRPRRLSLFRRRPAPTPAPPPSAATPPVPQGDADQAGLRPRLCAGAPVLGAFVSLRDPGVVGLLATAGYRLVIVDREHGVMGPETAQALVTAAHLRGMHAVVRVPEATRSAIQDALDGGADGIMVPGVESGEVAAQVAAWCRYPPDGSRGMHGLTAGSDHARVGGPALAPWANGRIAVMVQVETRRGLDQVDAIAAAPGVDLVFHGPSDLAVSLGIERRSPEAFAARRRILDAARAAGVGFGTFAFTDAEGREAIELGAELVVGGGDVGFVLAGAAALAGALRDAGATG